MVLDQANRGAVVGDTLLDLSGDGPLVSRLERALRDAVTSGRLDAGARRPASRRLVQERGTTRWVVTPVYEQLVAERALEARVGPGPRGAAGARLGPTGAAATDTLPPLPRVPAYDLRPGIPDLR